MYSIFSPSKKYHTMMAESFSNFKFDSIVNDRADLFTASKPENEEGVKIPRGTKNVT